MTNQEILHQLKEIQGQVNGLIQALEREEQSQSVTATVGEVRRAAILEEVYRQGGYNLQIAWSTGVLAGRSAAENHEL